MAVRLGTVTERQAPDVSDAVGNGDVGQAEAVSERITPDVGDTVGDRVASGFASRILDEPGLALVEQDPIQAAKAELSTSP